MAVSQERFADPALLVLASLADGERHGYAIMEDAKTLFGVQMGPGTLYGTIARLEERGLIALADNSVQASTSATTTTQTKQRRPYRLTDKGEAVLREELRRLSHLTQVALARLEKVTVVE